MDTRRLFYALWRKVWIMVILAILGGGIVYYLVPKPVPTYQANTTLYVMNIEKILQKGQTLNTGDLDYNRQLVQNFSELIKSRRVTSEAVIMLKASGINYVNDNLLNTIVSLGTQKDSNIIVISSKWTDAMTAAQVSNAMSISFIKTLNGLTNSTSIGILDEAVPPGNPVPDNSYMQKIAIGILAGIMLGFGIIYMQESFDTTIRSAEDVEQNLDLRVIGIIPEHQIK